MSEDLGVDFDSVPLEAWSVPVRAPVGHDPEAASRAMVCWIWNFDVIRDTDSAMDDLIDHSITYRAVRPA